MSNQPEFIWARLDNATLYADGSSPCVARTKEFANGTKYVRADASSQAEIERLTQTLAAINSLMGNVDHSRGGGENTARLYGGMLESIRELATAALSRSKE